MNTCLMWERNRLGMRTEAKAGDDAKRSRRHLMLVISHTFLSVQPSGIRASIIDSTLWKYRKSQLRLKVMCIIWLFSLVVSGISPYPPQAVSRIILIFKGLTLEYHSPHGTSCKHGKFLYCQSTTQYLNLQQKEVV